MYDRFWSGIFWVVAARAHHTRGDAARVFFINPVNGLRASRGSAVDRLPDARPAGRPGDLTAPHVKVLWPPLSVGCSLSLAEMKAGASHGQKAKGEENQTEANGEA